jgi:ferredoxin
MVYKILEYCVKCGGCLYECPAGAIVEGETQYIIDPAKCTDCGLCLTQNHCPAWAIIREPDQA